MARKVQLNIAGLAVLAVFIYSYLKNKHNNNNIVFF